MKIAVWVLFAFLLALWTGGTWATAELTRWAADLLASGQAIDLARMASEFKLPAWLAFWIDPAFISSALGSVVWLLEVARDGLPFVGTAVGWIVPLLWVLWGCGALVLLLLAGGAHFLVGRMAPAKAVPA